jgi:sugar phosphate isomerase/epimerase
MRTLTFGFLNLNTLPSGTAPPYDTLAAAAQGGFNSVGLRVTGRRVEDAFPDLVGSNSQVAALRQFAVESGMRISSVAGYGFFPDIGLEHHERVLETAAELGCKLMLLNVYYHDQSAFVDALAPLGECAARYGVRIALEFMPFSGLRTIHDAEKAIDLAQCGNIGHVIDALHLMRSGGTPADVLRVDPTRIFLGQLCDAKLKQLQPSDDELAAEARLYREYPGEGDAPLYDLLTALPNNLEIEVEVPRSDFGSMSFGDRARKTGDIFRQYMHEFDGRITKR